MLIASLLLAVGLAVVVFGGDLFVRAAVGIAEWLRLPRVVVGGTLMALATTTPEIVVSITAGLSGDPGLAVGNAIGSIICNFALIAALMAVISPFRVQRSDVLFPFSVLLVFCVLYFLLTRGGVVQRWESAVLLVAGLFYFAGDFYRSLRGRAALSPLEAQEVIESHHPTKTPWGSVGLFVVGAGLVVGGSRLLVSNASFLAEQAGISSLVIGLTIVAIGTSLPELVTAVLSARKGVADLSVGNLIGANVANLTLVTGAAGVMAPIPVIRMDNVLNFPVLMVVVVTMAGLLVGRTSMGRTAGFCLLGLYVLFLAAALLFARSGI
jgi:cation:H+ antiporter